MTGHAYAVSARTAARMGPFAGYHENREPMLEVLRMHRAEWPRSMSCSCRPTCSRRLRSRGIVPSKRLTLTG